MSFLAATESPALPSSDTPRRDRVLWGNRKVLLGRFEGSSGGRTTEIDGPVWTRPVLVFPRSSVKIDPEGRPPFVADPTVAELHNPADRHRRRALGRGVDLCDWVSLEAGLLFDLLPNADRPWARPFPASHVPCSTRAYLLLRHTVWYAEGGSVNPALVEAALLRIVELVVDRRPPGSRRLVERPTPAEHDLTERVKELLVAAPGSRHTAESIALEVGCSPYHLSRVFRRVTGRTLHGYLIQLRLRHSLWRVTYPESDLATVAFEHGFSSHSHFTAAFRRTFGQTPSKLRSTAGSVNEVSLRRLLSASRRHPRS